MRKFSREEELKLEQLSSLIDNNEIFTLNVVENKGLYRTRRAEILSRLFEMAMIIYPSKDYTLELVQTADNCLKYYKLDQGPFTRYFFRSFSKRYSKKGADIETNTRVNKDVVKVCEMLARIRGKYVHTATMEDVRLIADILGMEPSYVERIIMAEKEKHYMSDTGENQDGEKFNILELETGLVSSPEENYFREKCSLDLLDCAESIYKDSISSQRLVISHCFTAEIGMEILESGIDVSKYAVINHGILNEYEQTERTITEKEIAYRLGKKPASISRTYSEFKRKLDDYRKGHGGF